MKRNPRHHFSAVVADCLACNGPKYPFARMAVGDSFTLPQYLTANASSAVQSFRERCRSLGLPVPKFTRRKEPNGLLTRFWRTE